MDSPYTTQPFTKRGFSSQARKPEEDSTAQTVTKRAQGAFVQSRGRRDMPFLFRGSSFPMWEVGKAEARWKGQRATQDALENLEPQKCSLHQMS